MQVEIYCDPKGSSSKLLNPSVITSPRSASNTPTTSTISLDSPVYPHMYDSNAEPLTKMTQLEHVKDVIAVSISSDDPYIFTLPVRMVIPPSHLHENCNIYEEALGCLEPLLSLSQQI